MAPEDRRTLLRVKTRDEWRAWLERHHRTAREVWLVYAKVHTGRPSVRPAEAVEEALCFGWIDGVVKRVDADRYMQRFSPRTDTRKWSALNLQRFCRLVAEGRMTDAGRAKLPPDVNPPARRVQSGDPLPAFIRSALARHPLAREGFRALAPSYRRDYVRWITEAKRPETRQRRLDEAIRTLEGSTKPIRDPSRGPVR